MSVTPLEQACACQEHLNHLPDWFVPFVPPIWLQNGHLQTIVGNFLRRKSAQLSVPETFTVEVEPAHGVTTPSGEQAEIPATSVLCLGHWQPVERRRGALTVIMVHGLEGSANSGYILGNAARLWEMGCNVVRMNMRACGGSDALAPTVYHSGRSSDVGKVIEHIVAEHGCERIALLGYSMGGNLVFLYAGQQSLLPESQRQRAVCAVAGVSPLLDLAPSSAALHLPSNRLYERRFLRAMKRRLRAKAELFPALYGTLEAEGVFDRIRTMRDFDGEIVARFGGFRDADDYYEQVRASRYISALCIPTLVLHAQDDPFIRNLPETCHALSANPYVLYAETQHGGHCAFLSEGGGDEGRWAEETVARWIEEEVGL